MHNFDAFQTFADQLSEQFTTIAACGLFQVDISGDEIWEAYLAAFPEGTNPIFRERTEHDGVYDRQVLKRIGNVVATSGRGDFTVDTIWNLPDLPYPYNVVAERMHKLVSNAPIAHVFAIDERELGFKETVQNLDDGTHITWNHFYATVPFGAYFDSPNTVIGNADALAGVCQRGLDEITEDAVESVQSLIDENNLYRGSEFQDVLRGFAQLVSDYKELDTLAANRLVWFNHRKLGAQIRNSVIGTLLVDLSQGKDLETAVRAYESKVAPHNYKRPTALITQRMVNNAMITIEEEGLEDALNRRHAVLTDVSVRDVIWANNESQQSMKGGLRGLLETSVVKSAPASKDGKDISIEDFVAQVLPKTTNLEAYVANRLQSNLVSITAPVNEDVPPLFKWDNNFAWSYKGEVTDSVKERVKAAGGNIEADIRVSLSWFNTDDLDLHCHGPYGHIYFGAKQGILDVDQNAASVVRDPVENLAFNNPRDGRYVVTVVNFNQRESGDVGFNIEFECEGRVHRFHYPRAVQHNDEISTFIFTVESGALKDLEVVNKWLRSDQASEEVWGLNTESFVTVNLAMLSPNHWGDQAYGNKHWFFILDKAHNPDLVRGIYNEFLASHLEKHRKVFEVLGAKTRCEPADEQLSGLGFSSTKKETLTVKAQGPEFNELYNIQFG